ncbi:helix-turn-helix transcriptional regulator [Agathobaculum butyriciproducens]|uniref:Helix-turn-helix transcriptional regulator n=1 Tax=Agathobaculum butyriciproducens TaxID=1628085 RepID=A0AAW4VXL8_9FIRM|nr:helix-turn-helix transcriptional regulator [Agathobaculum butyriciproducens]
MTDKSAIIVKPSTAQAFETLWKRGRVLFFSAPCGFGKTVLADTLLDGRPVLRLNAADTGFALPSLEDAWDILLIDNIQDMQEERDGQALCALIRESTDRRFLLLSRGIPPACLMAFQYQKRDEAWREPLTAAEMQVLQLICADKSNAEIGEILNIRVSTVKSHVSSVLSKLGVNRRSEARTAAKKLWLISEDQ